MPTVAASAFGVGMEGVDALHMALTNNLLAAQSSLSANKLCNARFSAMRHNARMDDTEPKPRNYLREWRHFRHLSQIKLAELVGTSGAMINHLENGDRNLSHKWLIRLAPVLETTPGFILDHDPNEMSADLFDIWNRGSPDDQARLLKVAEAMIPFRAEGSGKTGTNGS